MIEKFFYKVQLKIKQYNKPLNLSLKIKRFGEIVNEYDEIDVVRWSFLFGRDPDNSLEILDRKEKYSDKTEWERFEDFIVSELGENTFQHLEYEMNPENLNELTEILCDGFLINHYIYNINGDNVSSHIKFDDDFFQEYIFYKPYIT